MSLLEELKEKHEKLGTEIDRLSVECELRLGCIKEIQRARADLDKAIAALSASPQIPEGFIPWSGGECPVDPATMVAVKLRGTYGVLTTTTAGGWSDHWMHDGSVHQESDIIAYRVLERTNDDADRDNSGDHNPVAEALTESSSQASSTEAAEDGFLDADTEAGAASSTWTIENFGELVGSELNQEVFLHTVNEASESPSELESQPEVGGDRVEPQLSHQFSSDIQQALSQQEEHLEGHVGITTRVRDGEMIEIAQPEAAYAPVNDALMWSNGFEADAKMKAEEPEAKRPFWMLAPKPKVNA